MMAELTCDQFADFFQAVHGDEPFQWQRRLAKEVLDGGGWYDVIRVPTACGKTSALDLALFELAVQADLDPGQRTAARRICLVVDRRLVVDEVTEHARRIRDAIRTAATGTREDAVLKAVARQLAKLAASPTDPLRVVRLRGGVYHDDGWAADPLTPVILVSTVDQIGSRLLFRGYGVSTRSRPAHAGLLAFDTRIILDEAHLSTVFGKTVEHIRQYQEWAEQSPLPRERRVTIVRVSATAREGGRLFELTEEERRDSRLKPRLDAPKPANLVEVKVHSITEETRKRQPGKARETEKRNRIELVTKLVQEANRLAGLTRDAAADSPRVIGVVVNRVATARCVLEALRKKGKTEPERDVILLTGRVRPYDCDRLLHEWLPRIKAGRETDRERLLFVVATQTVEVGANLDFDALVTEAAPLDALRQRFGRLDRLGKRHERSALSAAAIVIRSDQKHSHDDPVYGDRVGKTWKWLKKNATGRPRQVDFGVNHLDTELEKLGELTPLLAPQPQDPLLFPAHLDAWAQTDPTPEPDPDVAPFLHGQPDSAADVQVVWREDVKEGDEASWGEIVALMPPTTREALCIPTYELRNWLCRQATAEVADVEGPIMEEVHRSLDRTRWALRWNGPDDHRTRPVGPYAVRAGDTIVVPASYGGGDEFGWNPACEAPVVDVADECLVQLIASYPDDAFRRPKLRLRLHPALLPQSGEPTANRLATLLDGAVAAVRAEREDPWPAVRQLLQAMRQHLRDPARRAAVDALVQGRPQVYLYPKRNGLVLTAQAQVSLPDQQAPLPEELETDQNEDDGASDTVRGRQVRLSDHTQAVERISAAVSERCGLGEQLSTALRLAAHWHDQGKCDPRFQAWLHGSEIKALAALAAAQPLAKSGRDPKRWKASDAFGYPRGSRHELVSVRLFEEAEASGDVDSDLVKLLIGTHHGHGRAFVPVLNDPNAVEVVVTDDGQRVAVSSDHGLYLLDSGWTDLFWRLVRRYGWWGLAYLEGTLVTADRLASAHEQQRGSQSEGIIA